MTKRSKKTRVSDDTFAELMKSAEQALAYERGERTDCRVTRITPEHVRTTSSEMTSLGSTLKIQQEHKRPPNK